MKKIALLIGLSLMLACSSGTENDDAEAKGIKEKVLNAAGLGKKDIVEDIDQEALQTLVQLAPHITGAANEYQISEKVIQAILYRELALYGRSDAAQDYFSRVFRELKEKKAAGKSTDGNAFKKLWNMTKGKASDIFLSSADDLTRLWKVSFGIAQFQPHTFQSMVKAGAYVPKTSVNIDDLYSVLEVLNQKETAPYIVAAFVRQAINTYDQFRQKEISQEIDIIGTLYTIGAAGKRDPETGELANVNPSQVPKPNDHGLLIGKIAERVIPVVSETVPIDIDKYKIAPGCQSFKGQVPLFKENRKDIYDYTVGNGASPKSAVIYLKYYNTKDGLAQVTIHNYSNKGNTGYIPEKALFLARSEHRLIKVSEDHCN